jgi:valyl-tRNA synthetase
MGREKFIEACWDWTHEYGGTIVSRSSAWAAPSTSDEKFTMSPEFSRRRAQGLLRLVPRRPHLPRQAHRELVPHCRTAISDDEAEYVDEKGHLWYLRYPLTEPVDGIEYITVATTRPETMLGDTGVAVSPQDPEKQKLRGQDRDAADREPRDTHLQRLARRCKNFGTGFVKVTPAHDPNDFAMGQTHNLEQINIFDETAHVVDGYGEFSGMDRDEAARLS